MLLKITYISESGSIQPELQVYERYEIFRNTSVSSVMLTRTGKVNGTQVNQGGWAIKPERAAHDTLFAQLESLDLSAITPIEPQDIPEGAGIERYILEFSGGDTFSLDYTPGMDYSNGVLVTGPVDEFVAGLTLPEDAASRYTFEE